nr:NADH dehydrogenase subunit 4L [Ceratocombus japonicus]
MNLANLLVMFMFLSGFITFCLFFKHILLTLLSLEYLISVLFMLMILFLSLYNYEYYLVLIFMTFTVCEGAMGLSVLVLLIRMHGSDSVKTMSVMMC